MREGAGDGDWLGGRLAERGDWSEGAPAGGGWQREAFADLADLTASDLDVAMPVVDAPSSTHTMRDAFDDVFGDDFEEELTGSVTAAVLDRHLDQLAATGRFESAPEQFDVLEDLRELALDVDFVDEDDPISMLITASMGAPTDGNPLGDDLDDDLTDDITGLSSEQSVDVPSSLDTTDTAADAVDDLDDLDGHDGLDDGSDDADWDGEVGFETGDASDEVAGFGGDAEVITLVHDDDHDIPDDLDADDDDADSFLDGDDV